MAYFLFLFCASLAAAAGPETVTLTEETRGQGGMYHIEGSFEVAAPRSRVWGLLTDYSSLKGVVSSIQTSCVLRREGGNALVEQVAQGRFLFFRKTIRLLLEIEEEPPGLISFTEISGKPFSVYYGSWSLKEKDGAVAVTYVLNVSRAEMAPPFIERGLFKDNALALLTELKTEMMRRTLNP